jgi:hypothetical protein
MPLYFLMFVLHMYRSVALKLIHVMGMLFKSAPHYMKA